LGHPFLQQQNLLLQQQHSQQVKQHIRQAVLQRAGMENVDEETEAKLQQVMVICFYILYLSILSFVMIPGMVSYHKEGV
jgi:hypothetical protein